MDNSNILTGVKEINHHIFSYLDYVSILYLLESSKYLNNILKEDTFWRHYIFIQLKQNEIAMSILVKYHPSNESYYETFKFFYSLEDMKDCVKGGRCDAIKYFQVYNILPGMYESQLACKYGHVNVLEFLKKEYSILPTCVYLKKYGRKKKYPRNRRKLNPLNYPYERLKNGYGFRGKDGVDGEPGADGKPGVTFHRNNEFYALRIAIENNHVEVVKWLYENIFKDDDDFPNKYVILQYHYVISRDNKNDTILKYFKYINKRDNLGLII